MRCRLGFSLTPRSSVWRDGLRRSTRRSFARYFDLDADDLEFVRRQHSPAAQLGVALQLCSLRWLGFVPDDLTTAPPDAITVLAGALDVSPRVIFEYSVRPQTRREHRPMVRERAGEQTFQRLASQLTPALREALDRLLVPDPVIAGHTRHAWLRSRPTTISAKAMHRRARQAGLLDRDDRRRSVRSLAVAAEPAVVVGADRTAADQTKRSRGWRPSALGEEQFQLLQRLADERDAAAEVWNTVHTQRVLDDLRAAGELITTSEIEHISPLAHQHIHLSGQYPFDLASRPDGHRPLRTATTPSTPAPETLNRV